MPEQTTQTYTTKEPFKADILVIQESYDVYAVGETGNGYPRKVVSVDGGIMLKITITAKTLSSLQEKIAGHVALIE